MVYIFILILTLMYFFIFALCKTAKQADEKIEEMQERSGVDEKTNR